METKKKDRTDELRSQPVQEILSHVPGWIVRWGTTVLFFAVGMILLASWLIRYPDIVSSRMVVTANSGSQEMIGIAAVPAYSSGKVRTGQLVNVKLDNYPYVQYGIVTGVVKSISEVPENNSYSVEIALPDGLSTSYGKQLAFKGDMQGTAEIITDDVRLAERIFNQFRALSDGAK